MHDPDVVCTIPWTWALLALWSAFRSRRARRNGGECQRRKRRPDGRERRVRTLVRELDIVVELIVHAIHCALDL